MTRRELVAALLAARGEGLVVSGLGTPSYDVAAAGANERNFYLWGTMGSAAAVGLGVALAQPHRRVVVITGDGEMLMGISSLATIAVAAPANLAVLVLDNHGFAETGNQPGLTAAGVDLAGIADAAGFVASERLSASAGQALVPPLQRLAFDEPGPVFANVEVPAGSDGMVVDLLDGVAIAARFRAALVP